MFSRTSRGLFVILVVFACSIWVASPNSRINLDIAGRSIDWSAKVHQGLDLQGGLQVLLEADLPQEQDMSSDAMAATRTIVDQRVNGLGVAEPIVQSQGERRISVELPGIDNPDQAVALLKETGLLEFVDVGTYPLAPGTLVRTDMNSGDPSNIKEITANLAAGADIAIEDAIFPTVMTGADLRTASVGRDTVTGGFVINFTLTDDGSTIFGNHTSDNIGSYLAIVLDGHVISSPVIRDAITSGSGTISGSFTSESANNLALQLRYGALPVPGTGLRAT